MMQDKLELAKELIQQSRRLLYTTKEIMAVLDSNERILNSLLAGLEQSPEVEYDWSEFPAWANFAATDEDGSIWGYHMEPVMQAHRWIYQQDEVQSPRRVSNIGNELPCPHWQSTLRQRPVKPETVQQEIDVWALVPNWVKFVAMDECGDWFGYENRPRRDERGWDERYGRIDFIHPCPSYCDDWTKSLIERPQQTPNVWDSAPSWAKWLAMDKNGKWYWYSHEPILAPDGYRWANCRNVEVKCDIFWDCPLTCDNWKTSLMERPNA